MKAMPQKIRLSLLDFFILDFQSVKITPYKDSRTALRQLCHIFSATFHKKPHEVYTVIDEFFVLSGEKV